MNSAKLQDTRLIYRNLLFFCTLIMNYQKEIAKTKITFKISSKWKEYPGINLTKEVKALYSENYKTLMKGIEDDTNWLKDSCALVLE